MPRRTTRLKLLWREARAFFAGQTVDLLPARKGWSGYGRADLKADGIAGLNVALLALPQGMAFASIAGMSLAQGIACATVAAMAAGLFCASRFVALGPTNATAFTVFSFFATYPALGMRQAELMPWLAVLLGVIFVSGAFLHVAELVQYISRSVMIGYLSGAALLIMATQMKDVFAISLSGPGEVAPRTFFSTIGRLLEKWAEVNPASVCVAAGTLVIYEVFSRWRPRWPCFALAMFVATLLTLGVGMFQPMVASLPRLGAYLPSDLHPKLPVPTPNLLDDLGALFGLAFALGFISSLETSVTVKGMAGRSGEKVNLDQDFYGLGMANLASACVGGLPASGSLTRTALARTAGGKSRLSMLINGLICGGLAFAIGPLVGWIPKAVLAGLVIAVAWKLFNPRQIRVCLRATGSDAITVVATLLATLLVPLYVAIFTGIAVSVMLYLRKAARPELVEYEFNEEGALTETTSRRIPAIAIVHVEGDLFFGAADLFRNQIQRSMQDPMLKVIILRLRNARNLDATSVLALEELMDAVTAEGRHLLISGVTKSVYRVLRNAGTLERLDRRNVFIHSTGNPNVSTRNALQRAQEVLGTREAEIQIFVDQNKKSASGKS
ncbi:MAG: SulP family inorganic anion transporter [Verrucomicrobiales bacterium]